MEKSSQSNSEDIPIIFQNLCKPQSINNNFRPLKKLKRVLKTKSKTSSKLAFKEFNKTRLNIEKIPKFNLYINHLVVFPKKVNKDFLVSFADLTSSRQIPPKSTLFTTFGFEQDFFQALLKFSKVRMF